MIGKKYDVDSYQREYKWGKAQLDDLIDDLLLVFYENHKEEHERRDVKRYGQYFLGPIIVSTDDGEKRHIVDGQQRLTTLTLTLICLLHILDNNEQKGTLQNLIYSEEFGKKDFNLNVPERTDCLLALYEGKQIDSDAKPESVRNMIARYEQLQDKLADALKPKQASLFSDWLIEKVYLVEITTSATTDAYKIFETMNDRGLRLTPAEMLKGYILMEIQDPGSRKKANDMWKKQVDLLNKYKSGDAELIKSWLRGRYAETTTDFEDVGSQFHRWARNNKSSIGLNSSGDFERFVMEDFCFYTRIFLRLRQVAEKFDKESELECIYYLAQHNFTLQYPLLLASLAPNDSEKDIRRKLCVISTYLDILVHRRIGNFKTVAESTMRNQIFQLIPDIRDKEPMEIADFLSAKLEADEQGQTLANNFGMHQQNGPKVKRILARITDHIETQSQESSHYLDYFASGKKAFEIEHIWHADYTKVCKEEFMCENELREVEFEQTRNLIGGLLLLPQKDNASYGDIPYQKKREYYYSQNLLAKSLHEKCYEHNPGFLKFKQTSKLPFEKHCKFKKADMEQRQKLYCQIADMLWHPDRISEATKIS